MGDQDVVCSRLNSNCLHPDSYLLSDTGKLNYTLITMRLRSIKSLIILFDIANIVPGKCIAERMGSSLVRGSNCVRTLSKFFAHNSSAIPLHLRRLGV